MSDSPPASWRRAARIAALGARSLTGLAVGRDPAALAQQAAETLGDLRGLAAKVGQLGSYLDGVLGDDVPPGVREALATLNDATRTSSFDAIAEVIRADLGPRADAVLAAMERTPVAAGSIAQVHRAVGPDGVAVAVKVQHPGIARVVLGELAQAGLVARIAGSLIPGGAEVFAEVRGRFAAELDQRAEAEATRTFARAMALVPALVVPDVVDAWSGDRVLTTTWIDGVDLDTAATRGDEALRSRWATALISMLPAGVRAGWVHGDPNAGNARYRDDGTVGVLDLGCLQPVPREVRAPLGRAIAAADPAMLTAVLLPSDGSPVSGAVDLMAALLDPFQRHGRVERSTLHAIALATRTMKAQLTVQRAAAPPPWSPLVLRTWLGLLAHVAHLDAPIDGPAIRALAEA